MDDVQGLYIVTAVVLGALVTWVIVVLVRAPTAVDESQPNTVRAPRKKELAVTAASQAKASESGPQPSEDSSHPSAEPIPLVPAAPPLVAAPAVVAVAAVVDATKAPEATEPKAPATSPAESSAAPSVEPKQPAASSALAKAASEPRVRTMLGLPLAVKPGEAPGVAASAPAATPPASAGPDAPPVVVMPPMRGRLDSHPEIQDTSPNATVIVIPDEKDVGKAAPLLLVSAVGRSEPASGRTPEKHTIVERHHLFAFADGSGKKVGPELASVIAVEALTQAFEKDEPSAFIDDPNLSARANRVRRAMLSTNKLLLQRARKAGFAGLSTSALAAYFSPTNDELFLAHVGANRAYRLRGGHLTRLTSPHGVRFLGITDKVDVEVVTDAAHPKDLYLFCSDGLGRALGETELSAVLGADPSLERTTKALIEAVRGKDNTDDLVAIAVRVDPAAPPKKETGRAKTVMGLG
jgi:PPM family protein phosphatase